MTRDGVEEILCKRAGKRYMKLPNAESEHWSIKMTIIYSDWQLISQVSDRSLSYHITCDPILKISGIEAWGPFECLTQSLPLSHGPFTF